MGVLAWPIGIHTHELLTPVLCVALDCWGFLSKISANKVKKKKTKTNARISHNVEIGAQEGDRGECCGADEDLPTSIWQRLGFRAMLLTCDSEMAMVMLHILFSFLKNSSVCAC